MDSSATLETLMDRLRGRSSRAVGPLPSASDTELQELVESHAANEAEALQAYEELATTAEDNHVRYVARLILADEIRHHRLLEEIVNRLRSDIEWRQIEPSVPHVGVPRDRASLLQITKRLMDSERDDLRRVQTLRRLLHRHRYQSLISLVADLLEFDTRKHIAMLAFLHSTARA